MKTAAWYTSLPDGKVRCMLCPHHCLLTPGKYGICLTRQNRDGVLIALTYGRAVATAMDPIEKKPLYHFMPGARIFSSGPNGCTFKCRFCQNADISQQRLPQPPYTPPPRLAAMAMNEGSAGMAYTYSEPFIWFETILETAPLVKERGGINVMITNGFVDYGPLRDLLPFIDAMNIDIKSMQPGFYRHVCKGELSPVLQTCEEVKRHAHLEITCLLIGGYNDSEEEISRLAGFIAGHLGKETPLHLSRYFPRYRFSAEATPQEGLVRARAVAAEFLDYVYIGNTSLPHTSDTHCPQCKELLIERSGYAVKIDPRLVTDLNGTHCSACGHEIALVQKSSCR